MINSYYVTEQLHIECFFTMFEAHYDSTYVFPGESHDFWECLYVLNGTLCVSADDKVYRLKENQIIFHKPMELHKFSIESEEGADLFIFSFKLSGNLASSLEDKVFRLSEAQKNTVLSLLEYVRGQYSAVKKQIEAIRCYVYLEISKHVPEFTQILTTYIYQLFLSLISNGHASKVSTEPNAILFRRAVNYLEEQVHSQPSVFEVAEVCNTSPASLQRIFHKYAGMSVHKFFLKLKIIAATELLREGVNVTEVAERIGFSSQAYFSACYERETGKRPSEMK